MPVLVGSIGRSRSRGNLFMIYAHTIQLIIKTSNEVCHVGVIEDAVKAAYPLAYPDEGFELVSAEATDSERQPEGQ